MTHPANINLNKFAALLRTRRGERGLREVAEEIGNVSASTLSRIEQGSVPDLDTFVRICAWLKVSPNEFLGAGTNEELRGTKKNTPDIIEAHFRAEKTLPPDTIAALTKMIRLAYEAAADGRLEKKK